MGSDTDDVIDNLFDTVIRIFHEAIETSERGSELIHESLALLYYYFQKIDMKIVGSYIEPSDLLKKKKATINPNNKTMISLFSMLYLLHQIIEILEEILKIYKKN